jgi:hypothetical protein
MMTHWIAADRNSDRLVITGHEQSWLLMARFDQQTGALSLDHSFREPGSTQLGINFARQRLATWKDWTGGSSRGTLRT